MSSSFENKRKNLTQKSNELKEAIFGDFDEIKESTKEVGKNGLIVFGVLAIGYLFYKILSTKEPEIEHHDENSTKVVYVNQSSNNTIFNTIMKSIALFLLGIAQQKITAFLQQRRSEE